MFLSDQPYLLKTAPARDGGLGAPEPPFQAGHRRWADHKANSSLEQEVPKGDLAKRTAQY